MAVRTQARRLPSRIAGPPHPVSPRLTRWLQSGLPSLAAVALIMLAWELVTVTGWASPYVLPTPAIVLGDLWELLGNGTITTNAAATLQEAALGLLIAAMVALPFGYVIARVSLLDRFVAPVIAASQAVPAVAITPLLITSLGNGIELKVVVCAVVVVFPLLVSASTAFRGVPREYLEVAKVFGVTRWETIARVELPLAAPVLLAGVKLAVTLSLTGAIVGEFVAADQGLGFLLNFYNNNSQLQPYAFSTLVVLIVIGITAYSFVSFLEGKVREWQG